MRLTWGSWWSAVCLVVLAVAGFGRGQDEQTGQTYQPAVGDFSQLEVKRLRLFWEGTAFTPDLFYQFQIDGNTRGLAAWQGNCDIQNAGFPPAASFGAPGIGTAASPIGGSTLDAHGLRLFLPSSATTSTWAAPAKAAASTVRKGRIATTPP